MKGKWWLLGGSTKRLAGQNAFFLPSIAFRSFLRNLPFLSLFTSLPLDKMVIDEKLDNFFMFLLGPFCQFIWTASSKTSSPCFGQRKRKSSEG